MKKIKQAIMRWLKKDQEEVTKFWYGLWLSKEEFDKKFGA